jgi:hypothetical protein
MEGGALSPPPHDLEHGGDEAPPSKKSAIGV